MREKLARLTLFCLVLAISRGSLWVEASASGEKNADAVCIVDESPAKRWEDGLIGGNGATGMMVFGEPLEETIVVNHEKLWVVHAPYKREAVDTRDAVKRARALMRQNKLPQAEHLLRNTFTQTNRRRYGIDNLVRGGMRQRSDSVHPAFHLKVSIPKDGEPGSYRRAMVLDSGEVRVHWTDARGAWERRTFVSRPHDVIVLQLRKPDRSKLNCTLQLTEADAPGQRRPYDFRSVRIEHRQDEMYFHAAYGRGDPEGYHALARVICRDGKARRGEDHIAISDATEVLVLLRLEYLDLADRANIDALRKDLAEVPADYGQLLDAHASIHGPMFRRVRLDLGGSLGRGRSTAQILADAEEKGATAEFLELVHAVGRYALICSSGELPPTLMGIWGNHWDPRWSGHYTLDSNLNLAVAAGSQGNMPECMESYFRFVESLYPDWRTNAKMFYGCRGYMSGIAHGWRHGLASHGYFFWTGGAGWLSSYFYDHYLYTGDKEFLGKRVLPLLRQIALFYEDFLDGMEGEDGKYIIYPSWSPENQPSGSGSIVPNSTSEIAIIKQVLTNLIAACGELEIEDDSIPRWEAMLEKLPKYRINEAGALAEWSYPGLGDRYNHRHNSHLYGAYPGLEITREQTPALFKAAKIAIAKRLEAGRGDKSAHGLMHMAFFACRLGDPALLSTTLDFFARDRYLNSSLLSNHNPDQNIYNLDATLSVPAVLMEMLVYSKPGMLRLLPALPADKLPRGRAEGLLARGQITLESFAWNMEAGRLDLTLRSGRAQTVRLYGPRPIQSSEVLKGQGTAIKPAGPADAWQLRLPAGQSVQIRIDLISSDGGRR